MGAPWAAARQVALTREMPVGIAPNNLSDVRQFVRLRASTLCRRASRQTSDRNETGELQCLAIESRRGAAAQTAIACFDQAVGKIGR